MTTMVCSRGTGSCWHGGLHCRRVATYLDRILEVHRAHAALDPRSLDALLRAASSQPSTRGFALALEQASTDDGLAIIAEIKRRSPSKGALNADLDAGQLAKRYESGGATCLSVLTDHEFFGGSPADLAAAHEATALPVLRNDFTVSAHAVCDARLMCAAWVLLFAPALAAD